MKVRKWLPDPQRSAAYERPYRVVDDRVGDIESDEQVVDPSRANFAPRDSARVEQRMQT
ncbi:MAG TPA: hypothetical protein VHP33_29820 [Polyangiaceae bacterium]|nr:hypothetical protein [Polyangiaceae bacterium]